MEFTGFHCSRHGLAPIPWRIVPNPRNFDHFTSRWTTLNWCDQVGRHWKCAWGNWFFSIDDWGSDEFFWCRSCGQVLMQFNFRNSALRQRVDLRAGHRWRKAIETFQRCQLSAPGFDGVKYSVKRPLRRKGHGTWKGRANWEATLGNGKNRSRKKKTKQEMFTDIIQWFAFMFTYLRSEFVYVISFLRPLICRKDMDMSICFELMWYIVQRPLKSLNRVTG